MNNIIFLIFRRMRAPLLALVVTNATAVLGFVLIPGVDADGNVWHMDFFHAAYFVSFMSTTIGFGEIPHEFTDTQRLWVIVTIYATVVVWIYAIGNLLALVQDSVFQQAVTEGRFARRTKRLRSPFYLVCGYGETGSALIRALTDRDQHAVAIDIEEDRVNLLKLENLRQYVPALCGDAGTPLHLQEAGLKHPLCQGVVALTNHNDVNLKIAITSKLLHPEVKVICRADSLDVEENMASFGTDYIIDPFDTFATHLATALQAPGLNLLHDWLTDVRNSRLAEPVYPPKDGLWVLCGYGRFGKAVHRRLREEGIESIVIEANPDRTGWPDQGCVIGRGTEAVTLEEAEISRAVGLVAGTDDDANNLSIVMTARELNARLFVVVRQNLRENQSIVDAVKADMVMHPSTIIADRIRVMLATPLLADFLGLAFFQDDAWACELVSRIIGLVNLEVPEVWEVEINEDSALAVAQAAEQGMRIGVRDLELNPRERSDRLPCIALMHVRGKNRILLPEPDVSLKVGDKLLFCGRYSARTSMEWTLQNAHALGYVLTGSSRPQSFIWRLFDRMNGEARQTR